MPSFNKLQAMIHEVVGALPDRLYLALRYRQRMGFWPNLSEPRRFTEKLQWLKINDRQPQMTELADKLKFKELVSRSLGPRYVIPVLADGDTAVSFGADISLGVPFVLKTNHDSGGTLVFNDPTKLDISQVRKWIHGRLSRNFYLANREWEYKNIRPQWFMEPLLRDETGNVRLNDFKVHCFNGVPLFVQTIFDRGSSVKESWFDGSWKPLEMRYFSTRRGNIGRPDCLEEMFELAAKMAAPFPYVRVDFYVVNGDPILGEITFRPYGGFMKWDPDEADFMLGDLLNLDAPYGPEGS